MTDESMQGESLGRAEGDQEQHERAKTITFDDFIIELQKDDNKDARFFEKEVEEREDATASSSNAAAASFVGLEGRLPNPSRRTAALKGRRRLNR